jgi:hypothetical protein
MKAYISISCQRNWFLLGIGPYGFDCDQHGNPRKYITSNNIAFRMLLLIVIMVAKLQRIYEKIQNGMQDLIIIW